MFELAKLKETRIRLGFTQMEMCIKLGVSMLTYRMWERGVTIPNEQNMENLKNLIATLELKK